jgi:hypothetical protein
MRATTEITELTLPIGGQWLARRNAGNDLGLVDFTPGKVYGDAPNPTRL